MITEDALADLFEKAVHDLDPAIQAILIRAEQRGRRLRIRRRIWLALGSGLVVAALAGTAVAAGVPLAHPRGAQLAAGPAGRHPSPKHAGTGHASPKPPDRPSPPSRSASPAGGSATLAPGYQMTIGQMLSVLRRLLPAGSAVSNVNAYSAADGTLEVDYNDGQGAVDLMINIGPTVLYDGPATCPRPLWRDEGQRPAGALPISCVVRRLPDGSIERDAVMYADGYGFYGYNIYDQRPDGITVFLQVGNGILHGLPQVDRARPPGSMAGWESVVENPAWHLKKGWHLQS
jgi:hypothetical protein